MTVATEMNGSDSVISCLSFLSTFPVFLRPSFHFLLFSLLCSFRRRLVSYLYSCYWLYPREQKVDIKVARRACSEDDWT